jgi:endonuclease III related protein
MSPSTSGTPVLRAWRRIPGPPHDPVKARLLRLHRALERRFGPQRWWPGRTPFEVSVGAILTQHTAWTSAKRAIGSLRREGALTARAVDAIREAELARLIRAAGTYRLKARRLKAFTRWLVDRAGGRFAFLRAAPLDALRRELLEVPGLGPETVDAILLYAAGRPVFVAEAYARRVLARHGLVSPRDGYERVRRFVEAHLPSDPALFNEFHALLVEVGKRACRTIPVCDGCPLAADLITRTPRSHRPAARRHPGRRASGRARPSP